MSANLTPQQIIRKILLTLGISAGATVIGALTLTSVGAVVGGIALSVAAAGLPAAGCFVSWCWNIFVENAMAIAIALIDGVHYIILRVRSANGARVTSVALSVRSSFQQGSALARMVLEMIGKILLEIAGFVFGFCFAGPVGAVIVSVTISVLMAILPAVSSAVEAVVRPVRRFFSWLWDKIVETVMDVVKIVVDGVRYLTSGSAPNQITQSLILQ